MDDFPVDRPELNGSLISLEFGHGGRVMQLWASDPTMGEESDEFQFVLGPVSFGEEFSEDYYPGTILLGARTTPDEPWIVSRNAHAEFVENEDDPGSVRFEYDFPLLPEIRATGTFYEIAGAVPQIAWDLRIANRGRISVEIGELAFPFAFYNFMQGANRDEKGGRNPYQDRVYMHKFVGGAASYLHAHRMNNEAPGLLVFPGDDTSWEMYTHVPRSLTSHYHWEGIPVFYVFSRASVEREGWSPNGGEHTSLILEPGDSRMVQTRFVPTSPQMGDAVFHTLAACGRPTMRVLPAAVAPTNVGIALEVGGATPTKFFVSREAEFETDADEAGGFCFVKPKEPGPIRVSFEDSKQNLSSANLLFVEPIDVLIRKRAQWISEFQVHHEANSSLDGAILLTNIRENKQIVSLDAYATPFAVESGLSDALFLAEKNTIYPDAKQIELLDAYLRDFVRDDLQNPSDASVGCVFADFNSVALNYSRATVYPLVMNLYEAMYRIAKRYPVTAQPALAYLHEATRTAIAMFRAATKHESGGLPGYSRVMDVIQDLHIEELSDTAMELESMAIARARNVIRMPVNDPNDRTGDTARFEELFWAAKFLMDPGIQDLAVQHALAVRDLGPNWWSFGSDYRIVHELDGLPTDMISDKGQIMLGGTTVANSLMVFDSLDDDYDQIDDTRLRLAFGGLLGVWALIRPDGAASMGYCPDAASKHYGANPLTGDIGLALYNYVRRVKALVLPSRAYGVFTFGCHFEVADGHYIVQPWDGVGRRVSLRQIGLDVGTDACRILGLKLDTRKRWLSLELENASDFDVECNIVIRGLWGQRVEFNGETVDVEQGFARVRVQMSKRSNIELEMKVVP